ncbi:phospholipase D family protein [Halomonas urumqiensis]|nr:phospholipase D family protein [Halomonas urumqiensis]
MLPDHARRSVVPSGLLWCLLSLLLMTGCSATPVSREHRVALAPWEVADTRLGQWVAEQAAPQEDTSAFALLADGRDAFAVRALLTARAERRLDIQTYLMGDGLTTRILLHQVLLAADRGVEVRLLLDDIGAIGQGRRLASLDSHPNIEVRVFHPLPIGRSHLVARVLATASVFNRHHRRMHNKLWIADNALAIVGGRNLGDEYYNASEPRNFADLDMLTLGDVVTPLSRSFDLYWNHGLAQPVGRFHRAAADAWQVLRDELAARLDDEEKTDYFAALRERRDERDRNRLVDDLRWGEAEAFWDPPGKPGYHHTPALDDTMAGQLWRRTTPSEKLSLVSAYFVPTEAGSQWLQSLARSDVDIRVVTNSLEATDVPMAHGAYMPHREALLESGVELFELRVRHDNPDEVAIGVPGTSASALHIKALGIDDDMVFVGSPNADPRSVWWNSEVGVLAISEGLAADFEALVKEGAQPTVSYSVELDAEGKLAWLTREDGAPVKLEREPGNAWRRLNAWLSRVLGLERWL